MNKLFYLVWGAGLLMASCAKEDSSDVNQDKIYTEYEIFYNQNDDKTHALAQFRFGGPTGTLLELTDSTGAQVTFDGTVMPYAPIWGAHHLEFPGKVSSGTFSYTNTDGTTFVNSISHTDTISYPVGFDTIVKSVSENFVWGGPAIQTDEHVNLFVGTWTWGNDAFLSNNTVGDTNIVMGVLAKNNLAEGSSTVYMDRVLSKSATQAPPTHGGTIKYRYRPTNAVDVQVVP